MVSAVYPSTMNRTVSSTIFTSTSRWMNDPHIPVYIGYTLYLDGRLASVVDQGVLYCFTKYKGAGIVSSSGCVSLSTFRTCICAIPKSQTMRH